MADLAVLRTAKQAMGEGLIGEEEFQAIKTAFTKAQMIKAGLDAGFIREEDYMQARNSFLQSLDFQIQENHTTNQTSNAGHVASMFTAPAVTRVQQAANNSRPNSANGHVSSFANGGSRQAAAPAASAAAVAPPPPPPAPTSLLRPPGQAGPRGAAAAAASAVPQSTSGQLPGTIPIPTDLGRIGRANAAEGKKSMSGIGVHDSCINIFNHIKTRSAVIVDQLGASDSTYDEFLATLPGSQCRYAVYDYAYSNNDTGQVNQKLVFVHWAPSGSSIKSKMMYASTKEFIKGFLEGVGAELQADTVEELTEKELVDKIASSMARK